MSLKIPLKINLTKIKKSKISLYTVPKVHNYHFLHLNYSLQMSFLLIFGRPRVFFTCSLTTRATFKGHVEADAMEARDEHVDENLRDFFTPFGRDEDFVIDVT